MGLCDDESIFTLASKHKELDSLLLGSLKLTEVSDHEGTLRQLRLCSEDILCALWVIKVIQVKSDDVFIVISLLVSLLSLTIVLFCFFSFSNENEDGRRCDLIH